MTQEEKRIKLAEAVGWTPTPWGAWTQARGGIPSTECPSHAELPDYFNDLNEVHELEEILEDCEIKWADYRRCLIKLIEPHRHELHATASQRCEALGLTLNLWK